MTGMSEHKGNDEEYISVQISQLLEEAQCFVDGDGNHLCYAREDGSRLIIPPTEAIIDELVARARSYATGLLEADTEKKIEAIYDAFQKNMAISGREDGYLVNSDDLLYGNTVGG